MEKALQPSDPSPFKKCKKCGALCSLGVNPCFICYSEDFENLTVEELIATADEEGKIRVYSLGLPDWPHKGAWQVVDAKKEDLEKPP